MSAAKVQAVGSEADASERNPEADASERNPEMDASERRPYRTDQNAKVPTNAERLSICCQRVPSA
jgi:hypothetical protein